MQKTCAKAKEKALWLKENVPFFRGPEFHLQLQQWMVHKLSVTPVHGDLTHFQVSARYRACSPECCCQWVTVPIPLPSWPRGQLSYLSQVSSKRGESPCLPLPLYNMAHEKLAKSPMKVHIAGSPMPHQWIQSTVLPGKGKGTSYPSVAAAEEQNQHFHFHVPGVCFSCLQ